MGPPARTFRQHFLQPSGRTLPEGDLEVGEAENTACGDWVRFQVHRAEGRIQGAAVQVRGCSATIACASLAVEALEGLDLEAARALDVAVLAKSAGATPRELSHAPAVVARALLETLAAAH